MVSPDIRAGVSLLIAALAADEEAQFIMSNKLIEDIKTLILGLMHLRKNY